MYPTIEPIIYEAFGLRIKSGIELPELVRASDHNGPFNIEYRIAARAKPVREYGVELVNGKLYIKIPGAAEFCVQKGEVVEITPDEKASVEKIRLYLLGSCMGAVLLQRGILPLHGSAVALDGKAYVFIGNSGAGKSTLAASLVRQGAQLLSDDIAAVYMDGGQPRIAFAYPQQKLWRDSLEHIGLEVGRYRTVPDETDKYAVPMPSGARIADVPLAGIYELVPQDADDAFLRLEDCKKLERIHLLLTHTYRRSLVIRLGLEQWLFGQAAALATRVYVKRLIRPAHAVTIGRITELMFTDMRRNETDDRLGDHPLPTVQKM